MVGRQLSSPLHYVIPAKAGIQGGSAETFEYGALDSRLRGNDVVGGVDSSGAFL